LRNRARRMFSARERRELRWQARDDNAARSRTRAAFFDSRPRSERFTAVCETVRRNSYGSQFVPLSSPLHPHRQPRTARSDVARGSRCLSSSLLRSNQRTAASRLPSLRTVTNSVRRVAYRQRLDSCPSYARADRGAVWLGCLVRALRKRNGARKTGRAPLPRHLPPCHLACDCAAAAGARPASLGSHALRRAPAAAAQDKLAASRQCNYKLLGSRQGSVRRGTHACR
jgi:hypothetical protein